MQNNRRLIYWQGWRIELPHRWDPVKLEGDSREGHALFADTLRPRLGLRWQTINRKLDPDVAIMKALKGEVGQLAADEAKLFPLSQPTWQSPLLYIEPEPPGRDVFSVYSETSSRLLQVVYHAHRRENVFATALLPSLRDVPLNRAAQWSIFDLNCVIPGGMKLKSQRLNAGDLGLTFADRYNEVTVRQISVAQLALQRQSLDGWISNQQKTSKRYYRPTRLFSDLTLIGGQTEMTGRISRMCRPMRFSLMWNLPPVLTTIALHDIARDRLIILHGSDESLLIEIASSVGVLYHCEK